jgi:uncharacterized membrane-anchored protein YjiN (DUF445 family)
MKKEQAIPQPRRAARNNPSPDRAGSCARCERMAQDDARDIEMLRELAALGMEMARAVQGQVMEQIAKGREPSGDPGLVFSRIAKTVRQAIALKRKIAEEADAREHRTAEQQTAHLAQQAGRAATAQRSMIEHRKERVQRGVERLIEQSANDSDYENLLEDLYDRLDDYQADGELSRATVDEMIARIAKELGYVPAANDDDDEPDGADAGQVEDDPPNYSSMPPQRLSYAGRNGHDPP